MKQTTNQTIFQQQYHQLFAYAYTYTTYRVHDVQEAEDIVSQALVDAYAQIEQFDPVKGELVQWLTGILRFKVINYWRRNKTTIALEEVENELAHLPQYTTEQIIDQQLLFNQIMEQLSPKIQTLFALRYVDDMTYEEIARAADLQPDNVRKIFSLTHKKLRNYFNNV